MRIKKIEVQGRYLQDFCRKNHIKELSLFGSILRDDFTDNSDVDILVTFEIEHIPGLIKISSMERELSGLFDGRKIDLRTPDDISRYYRNDVVGKRRVLYAET